jgi:hypothetical protein
VSRIRDIVICCTSAHTLARFWAEALDGYQIRPYDDAEIARLAALGFTLETDPSVAVDGPGPTLFLQETADPPTTSGRGHEPTQNQIHLDLVAARRDVEISRLCTLGATVRDERDGYTRMRDPEGNSFCVRDPD